MKSDISNLNKEQLIEKVKELQNILNVMESDNFFIYHHIGKYQWNYDDNEIKIINDSVNSPLSELADSSIIKIHTEDTLRVFNELKEHLISEFPFFTIEFRIKLKNGSYKWLRTFGRVLNYDEVNNIFILNFVYKPTDKETDNIYKLKVERVKFKQLFDHFNAGVVLIDKENIIIDINDKFSEIFGYSLKEARGNNVDDLIVPDKLKKQGGKYSVQVLNGKSIELETVRETKSGDSKDVFLNAFPMKLEGNQLGAYAIYYDISERKELLNKLKIENVKFQQLFNKSNVAIALVKPDNTILDINYQFQKTFGYTLSEAKNKILDDLIVPTEYKSEAIKYAKEVIDGTSVNLETIRRTKYNKKIDVSINAFPILLNKKNIGVYAMYTDISASKKSQRYVRYLSFHDELTGLYNRRYFDNEIRRLNNSRILPISIIMGDLDNLKLINDDFGHATGDKYLKVMADLLKRSIRSEDILARVGGDEFAIILPEANIEITKRICTKIYKECKKMTENSEMLESFSISLGYATKEMKSVDLEEVYNKADEAMYRFKKGL